MAPHPAYDIRHDRQATRFETRVEGQLCQLHYSLATGVMTITHTGVAQEVEGRGIAGALMQAAVDTARREGWKIAPDCSYAKAWLQRHPGYADLVA